MTYYITLLCGKSVISHMIEHDMTRTLHRSLKVSNPVQKLISNTTTLSYNAVKAQSIKFSTDEVCSIELNSCILINGYSIWIMGEELSIWMGGMAGLPPSLLDLPLLLHMIRNFVKFCCNPLEFKGNYSATSNNTKLIHWPLMGGLLHLVQQQGHWAGLHPTQAPPRCTKCNSPPINGQCTNHNIAVALRF